MAKKQKAKVPEGLTEAARRERQRFNVACEALLKEVRKLSLSILVWGPNPQSESVIARKRNAIRDELKALGHNAMFSEELTPQVQGLSEKSKEFAQATVAHLVIILVEGSPGALAETHDFCNHPDIAPKVYVMVPTQYREGYSAKGAIKDLEDAHGGVYWYREDDVRSCNLLTQAVKRAEARRNILYRAGGSPS